MHLNYFMQIYFKQNTFSNGSVINLNINGITLYFMKINSIIRVNGKTI